MGNNSSTSLAPGFRFHPTDEELVRYYLKRKICGKPLRVDPITETDIYKSEPWELPEKSKMKTRDLEWYFFTALDKKYGNSSRTNRATENGYWKTTGTDRPIRNGSHTVGMKKTLVYHSGRAPKGVRTNWVMHEYRLEDEELVKAGIAQDALVLCRIFQKSGSGPKNGEKYGAPFIEEEWEDDVMAVVPGDGVLGEEAQYSEGLVEDAAFFDANEIEPNFGVTPPSENAAFPHNFYPVEDTCICVDNTGNLTEYNPSEIAPRPSNFYHGETSNCVELEPTVDFSVGDLKPAILRETSGLGNDQAYFEMPQEQYGMDLQPVREEYFVQSSDNGNPMEASYSDFEQSLDATENTPFGEQVQHATSNGPFGEQVLDATNHSPFDEGLFLETNDLSKPLLVGSPEFDIDDYLNFFDAGENDSQDLAFDAAELMGTENAADEQLPQMFGAAEAEVVPGGAQLTSETHSTNEASSSNEKPEFTKTDTDFKNPFLKHASQILDSIPAPPAFAAEFPSKEAALRLNSTAQASSSVHVTAGMIRIRNMNLDVAGADWSFGKNDNVDLILSYYGSPQADDASTMVPTGDALSLKASSVVRRGWFLFMFIWVLFISVTCKFGSYIYSGKCLDS